MIHRQVLQHADQTAHHPAVATAPENLFAVGFLLFEKRAVAEKEMLVLVIKIIRRAPPVLHGKFQIMFVTRRGVKAHPRRRPHEQRVAPRPVFTRLALRPGVFEALHIGRLRKNRVKFFAQRRNHLVFAAEKIKFRVGLPDAVVIRVVKARPEFPIVRLAHRAHRVAVFRIAGNSRQRHEARFACRLNPAHSRVGRGIRQLPVGHALHRGEDGQRFDFR